MGDIVVFLLRGLVEKGLEIVMGDLVKIGIFYVREVLSDLFDYFDENI